MGTNQLDDDLSAQDLETLWLAIGYAEPTDEVPQLTGPPGSDTTSKRTRTNTISAASLQMRRKRNSASMRWTTQRKKIELRHLRQQAALLEHMREELNQTQLDVVTPHAVQELLQLIKTYQHEQLCLHNAIQHHEKLAAALSQTIAESKSLNFANTSIYSGMRQRDESFLWVNSVLPFLPVFSKSQVSDLVRESYLDIVRHVRAADLHPAAKDLVFGWTDKRVITDEYTDFMFGKDFQHEDLDALASRTWEDLTSKANHDAMKKVDVQVLEKLNDDTLIMAKSVHCVLEDRYYCFIYVVLRVQTPDGYVIGSRTICPLPQHTLRLRQEFGSKWTYSYQYYSVALSRLAGDARPVGGHPRRFLHGCSVKRGGRMSNGKPAYAQRVGASAMLSTLRWENTCVKPLRYLDGK